MTLRLGLMKSRLATGILMVSTVSGTALAGTITIDFNGISGKNGAPFNSYTESGFTVSATSADWLVGQNFGDPAPYIYFNAPAGKTVIDSIAVTDGGSDFSFSSIDLYSSTTVIPYTLTAILNGNTVFTVSGTVPNTFGNFALLINPDSTAVINTLELTLTDPAAPCCSNPVGLDNITMVTTASSVPEPASLTLLLAGLAGLSLIRHKARSSSGREPLERSSLCSLK
jgi:hypothetical protein